MKILIQDDNLDSRQRKLINFELDHDFKFEGDLMQCKWD